MFSIPGGHSVIHTQCWEESEVQRGHEAPSGTGGFEPRPSGPQTPTSTFSPQEAAWPVMVISLISRI